MTNTVTLEMSTIGTPAFGSETKANTPGPNFRRSTLPRLRPLYEYLTNVFSSISSGFKSSLTHCYIATSTVTTQMLRRFRPKMAKVTPVAEQEVMANKRTIPIFQTNALQKEMTKKRIFGVPQKEMTKKQSSYFKTAATFFGMTFGDDTKDICLRSSPLPPAGHLYYQGFGG